MSVFYPQDYHPDRQDIQKSMTAFKNLSVSEYAYVVGFLSV